MTSFFRYLALQQGHICYTYIDDVIGTSLPDKVFEGYKFFLELLSDLNFPISYKKLVAPTHETICLGICINTRDQTVSIPTDKQREILVKCQDMITKKSVTKTKFQSLIGSLMFVHKCIRSSRTFTNRLLENLRNCEDKFVKITPDVIRDISWFLEFMPKFNGSATYVHELPALVHTIAIDASLDRVGGLGQ